MDFSISKGVTSSPKRIVLFGTGGVGKSEAAANLEQVGIKPLFFDIESGTSHLDVSRVRGVSDWMSLRSALHDESLIAPFDAVVVDSGTKAEEWCGSWVVDNVPHDKPGRTISRIEDYGYGKGLSHIYETFLLLLQDLDAIVRRGKHVVVIAHDCVSKVPNPNGESFIRYEPRLQNPESGKNSIRLRIKEWCDHLLFIGYDVYSEDGKGVGSGTRTFYGSERPAWMAKSRPAFDSLVYQRGSADIWKLIFGKEGV